MIIDCHTHAWDYWPYEPPVPDPESRGRAEQLLWEMDGNGVDMAVLVCARIDHNPHNNEYGTECVRRFPERLIQFADVDCSWTDTYHTSGAAERLRDAAAQYRLKGYTHYLKGDYEWFESAEGIEFFEATEELGLIVSMPVSEAWHPHLRKLARRFPATPFLCHHMAGARASEGPPHPNFREILESSEVPNIYIKLSGFAYVSQVAWDYPYSDCLWMVRKLYEHYGPERLCWGSDYPVVLGSMTYQHALEAFRTHCAFVPDQDKALILGGNMHRLLQGARE